MLNPKHANRAATSDLTVEARQTVSAWDLLLRWCRRIPVAGWFFLASLIFVAGFSGKAVHIDDTLFLRAAQHIQKHPADFYGFNINWSGTVRPMSANFENPPVTCYYLAIVGSLTGWSDMGLHLGMVLPVFAAMWGMFSLARRFCNLPLLATLVAATTPVFLVSATTLMCDVMLVAFWVWAMVWFQRGLETNRTMDFAGAGALAGLAFLTKFTALGLVLLLFAYGAARSRRVGAWLLAVAIPMGVVVAYEWLTHRLYGNALLWDAVGIASNSVSSQNLGSAERLVIGVSFVGGCLLPVFFFVPQLWSGRSVIVGLLLASPIILLYPRFASFVLLWDPTGTPDWLLYAQSIIFILSGLHILALPVAEFWRRKDASSLMLLFWVFGIFIFASRLNWTLNARSVLPMVPAVALLVANRLEWRAAEVKKQLTAALVLIPVSVGLCLGILIARADADLANVGRVAASEISSRYRQAGRTIWFEGHWGFQYYMETLGAKTLDVGTIAPDLGDIIVIPTEAVSTFDIPTNTVRALGALDYRPNRLCATISRSAGAGFYAATAGPFPYSFGDFAPESYYLFEVIQPKGTVRYQPTSPFMRGAVAKFADARRTAPSATH